MPLAGGKFWTVKEQVEDQNGGGGENDKGFFVV